VWDAVEGLQTAVTGDILKFNRLDLSARKVGGDAIIGEGSVSLRAAGVEYGKAVTVVVKMKDKRGKPKGRVELILQVDPSAKATRAKKAAMVSAAFLFLFLLQFMSCISHLQLSISSVFSS
jgi:hypothetical protein